MIKDIIIVGAGGLGREVLWLIEELNSKELIWNIIGFVDDNKKLQKTLVNDYPVVGDVDWLVEYQKKVAIVCCIAKPKIRENITKKLLHNANIEFPNIIAEGVRFSDRVSFGKGNIICLSSSLTVDIKIGNFNIINPACTIGHDVLFNNNITLYPGVNVSGNVSLGNLIELGTGSQIIQGLNICDDVIIGAGSVVTKDIMEAGTYVGAPVRRVH